MKKFDDFHLRLNEKFFIAIIKLFGRLLTNNKYLINSLIFNDRDDDKVSFESYSTHNQIWFTISPGGLIEKKEREFNIYFLRPQKILGIFTDEDHSDSYSLEKIFEIFPAYKNLPRIITDENFWDVLSLYTDFLEKELMPFIKAEKWFDKL